MNVISNASPIILLDNVGRLDVLQALYKEVVIPEAVYKEVFEVQKRTERPGWIKVEKVSNKGTVRFLMNSLGSGESEAIVLALESKADLLLLDDYHARVYANSFGLRITGVAGIIVDAKDKGIIGNVKKVLSDLIKKDYRISDSLYNAIIKEAGE